MDRVAGISRRLVASAAGIGLMVCAAQVNAQAWPAKPVRLIVPIAAGGSVDTIGRAMAQKFAEAWKQPVVVENRAGAGGMIGADLVAKSAPDGYTLLINSTTQASSAALYRKLPYDALNDFAPMSAIITTYQMLVASTSLQAQSVKELIALARAQPGKLNMGSSGTGSSPHLVGELFRLETGVDVVHVPYKGDVALQPALIGGEVHFAFVSPIAALQHLKTGRLRGLAVTGLLRAAVAPDVPTMVEAGVPDFEFVGWVGFFGPAKTPREVQLRVAAETARTLAMPDIAERVPGWGGVATGSSPEDFTRRYRTDLAKFARIVKDARVPLTD